MHHVAPDAVSVRRAAQHFGRASAATALAITASLPSLDDMPHRTLLTGGGVSPIPSTLNNTRLPPALPPSPPPLPLGSGGGALSESAKCMRVGVGSHTLDAAAGEGSRTPGSTVAPRTPSNRIGADRGDAAVDAAVDSTVAEPPATPLPAASPKLTTTTGPAWARAAAVVVESNSNVRVYRPGSGVALCACKRTCCMQYSGGGRGVGGGGSEGSGGGVLGGGGDGPVGGGSGGSGGGY